MGFFRVGGTEAPRRMNPTPRAEPCPTGGILLHRVRIDVVVGWVSWGMLWGFAEAELVWVWRKLAACGGSWLAAASQTGAGLGVRSGATAVWGSIDHMVSSPRRLGPNER